MFKAEKSKAKRRKLSKESDPNVEQQKCKNKSGKASKKPSVASSNILTADAASSKRNKDPSNQTAFNLSSSLPYEGDISSVSESHYVSFSEVDVSPEAAFNSGNKSDATSSSEDQHAAVAVTKPKKLTATKSKQMATTKPIKMAATKPNKMAATKPNKMAATRPNKMAATRPNKMAATRPNKMAATKPNKMAATKPNKMAATKPNKMAATELKELAATKPNNRENCRKLKETKPLRFQDKSCEDSSDEEDSADDDDDMDSDRDADTEDINDNDETEDIDDNDEAEDISENIGDDEDIGENIGDDEDIGDSEDDGDCEDIGDSDENEDEENEDEENEDEENEDEENEDEENGDEEEDGDEEEEIGDEEEEDEENGYEENGRYHASNYLEHEAMEATDEEPDTPNEEEEEDEARFGGGSCLLGASSGGGGAGSINLLNTSDRSSHDSSYLEDSFVVAEDSIEYASDSSHDLLPSEEQELDPRFGRKSKEYRRLIRSNDSSTDEEEEGGACKPPPAPHEKAVSQSAQDERGLQASTSRQTSAQLKGEKDNLYLQDEEVAKRTIIVTKMVQDAVASAQKCVEKGLDAASKRNSKKKKKSRQISTEQSHAAAQDDGAASSSKVKNMSQSEVLEGDSSASKPPEARVKRRVELRKVVDESVVATSDNYRETKGKKKRKDSPSKGASNTKLVEDHVSLKTAGRLPESGQLLKTEQGSTQKCAVEEEKSSKTKSRKKSVKFAGPLVTAVCSPQHQQEGEQPAGELPTTHTRKKMKAKRRMDQVARLSKDNQFKVSDKPSLNPIVMAVNINTTNRAPATNAGAAGGSTSTTAAAAGSGAPVAAGGSAAAAGSGAPAAADNNNIAEDGWQQPSGSGQSRKRRRDEAANSPLYLPSDNKKRKHK